MVSRSNLLFLSVLVLGTPLLWATSLFAGEPIFKPVEGGMGCLVEELKGSEDSRIHVQGASWDGKWLSFTEEYGQDEDGKPIRTIFLLNLVSGERTALPASVTNSGAFSPDGKYMVAAFEVDSERTDIWEIDLETQELNPVAQHDHWDWLPSYSPDGSYIVFNSWRNEDQAELYIYDRETRELRRMTNDPRYDAHGEFSPDGKKLMFNRMMAQKDEGGYDFEIFVIDLASGEEKQISPGSPFEESYASWAPDSEHVVISSDHDGKPEKHNLYVMGMDGEYLARLTKGDWKDSYAFWSRDGNYIYFTSERSGRPNVYRMPMDGLDCNKG